MHKQRLVEAGLCTVLPQLISNHRLIMSDAKVQDFGLECLFEMCTGSNEARAQLIEAGLVEALDKVAAQHTEPSWRALAQELYTDLDMGVLGATRITDDEPALSGVVVDEDDRF
eukprot:FR734455.1.p1 GENE.FR734455.1~~FR734455.1.p1  ORF type:complete len:114 (+),score=15.78 FR734455.1:271-612(+)